MEEPWKCGDCGSRSKPSGYRVATLCKECKSKRMKASKPTYDITCQCGNAFQAKSKIAKWCPDCKEKREKTVYERMGRVDSPIQPTIPAPPPSEQPVEVQATVTKRDIDIKMKGVCNGRNGLMEELSKLVEMMGTWEAGEIQFAIYVRGQGNTL